MKHNFNATSYFLFSVRNMEKIRIYVLICVVMCTKGLYSARRKESSPVLIWTADSSNFVSTDASPLEKMPYEEFQDVLKKLIKFNYQLFIFVEKILDVEDFLLKNDMGEDCFQMLKDIQYASSMAYFPQVQGAVNALESVINKYVHNQYNITSSLFEDTRSNIIRHLVKGNENVVVFNFLEEDSPNSRFTTLRQHDEIISQICRALEYIRKTMCIYTGRQSHRFNLESIEEEKAYIRTARKKRSADEDSDSEETISLSDFDRPRISEVEGASGTCDHDCTYEASDEGTSISIHLATAPTLWYGNREIVLKKFLTSMIIVNESLVILRVRTPEADLSFNFHSFPNGNWFLNGVTLEMRDEDVMKRAGQNEESLAGYGQIFMASNFPLMARVHRTFHCLLTEFNGANNTNSTERRYGSPQAKLYLYKMNINAHFPPRDGYYRVDKDKNQNSSKFHGVDYCIPFANAAVLMAFIIVSSMVILVMTGMAMLMTAKANDKWDTQAQKVLLAE